MSSPDTPLLLDPDAVRDLAFDWSEFLATGETITAHVLTAEACTVTTGTATATTVTGRVSAAAYGAQVTCQITTSSGQTDQRTRCFRVTQR